MARLIRNYRPGSQVVVAERPGLHGNRWVAEPIERAQALLQAAHQEAEALRQEAQAVLEAARQEAEQIRAAAEAQADTIRATAEAQGYQDGYQRGVADGRAEVQALLAQETARLQSLLDAIQAQRAQLMQNVRQEVLALVVAACERIVGQLAQSHRPLIVHTVTKALDALTVEGPFTVRLHPEDRAFLEAHWQATREGREYPWQLVEDPQVEPGGCVVQCGPATADARLSTQLRLLAWALDLEDYRPAQEEGADDV